MPYFPVDDQMPFHPKIIAAQNPAVGVWTRAGAWSKGHATGGFIPTEIATALGAKEAKRLVAVGLWVAVEGGFQFHDWDHQAGNDTAEKEKERRDRERERNRARKQAQREREKSHGHGDSHGVTPGGIPAPVTVTPSPSPSDVTYLSESSHLPDAQEIDSDPSEIDHQRAQRSGINDLRSTRALLQRAVGQPITNSGAVILAEAIVSKSAEHVRNVDSYVATVCRNSHHEVQQAYFDLDIEGVV